MEYSSFLSLSCANLKDWLSKVPTILWISLEYWISQKPNGGANIFRRKGQHPSGEHSTSFSKTVARTVKSSRGPRRIRSKNEPPPPHPSSRGVHCRPWTRPFPGASEAPTMGTAEAEGSRRCTWSRRIDQSTQRPGRSAIGSDSYSKSLGTSASGQLGGMKMHLWEYIPLKQL